MYILRIYRGESSCMFLFLASLCSTTLCMKSRKAQKTMVAQVRLTELEFYVFQEVCTKRHQMKSVVLRDLIWKEAQKVGVDIDRLKQELHQGRFAL